MSDSSSSAAAVLGRLRGRNNEGVLLLIILLLIGLVAVINPSALTLGMASDILRSAIVNMTLALGLLLIIVSGGIDVSFTAIAIFSGYSTVVLMQSIGLDNPVLPFLGAIVIGALLGILNAVLVAGFRLPTLIATLGTQGIIRGALLALVGSLYISTLPASLAGVGATNLITLDSSPVNVLVIPVVVLCLVLAFVLKKTMFGRSVYAIGGSPESAKRAGIRVGRVQTTIYVAAGAISGFAGMTHVTVSGHASPFELVGTELDVIAAVVIGGASDSGGRGSVQGVALGVLLIALIQNSLVRLGVPGFWHEGVVGLVILVGVAIQAQSRRIRNKRSMILEGAIA
ncbi:ABC transporter permease [Microbacterium dauci]|uniref:ABC transporter permease n=1 Tax=Microbacterium dauci TaxID=3048008 RepID=A0ABT6ZEF6_9MICO|nr:ABC transporter permease [Microbacterium sp. LX3-4]MDJ1114551.1 ABC transporter permease [Microbacterium sp. LX3-4]